MADISLQEALIDHLAQWGLRRFTSDDAYFQWQRQALSSQELSDLHRFIEQKRRGAPADEIAFYDLTANPRILPVLYSQRYEYYREIGSRVASCIGDARTVLDFGCGVGILTTFYAKQFPDSMIVGLDRSPASIARAKEFAAASGLKNVRFECLDMTGQPLEGMYDLIVSTHALVQAEQDPGVPSRDWTTFDRAHDRKQQQAFEACTGIGLRLDRLGAALASQGRMVVFEKTRQLARRIPFQRALAARGLSMIDRPEPIRHLLVEEVADDGPFYLLQKDVQGIIEWDESPEPDEGRPCNPATWTTAPMESGEPLYENHHPSAQRAWRSLPQRTILKETTRTEPDGRQMHIELGRAEGNLYIYCANTFDQRQLVVVEPANAGMLETYYQEIVSE